MTKGRIRFIELFQNLIKRPAMYKINKVEDIELICFGYIRGLGNSDEHNEIQELLNNFRKSVNSHFESDTDVSWERLIRFYSGGDKHSLELFETLFDLYILNDKGNSSFDGAFLNAT